MLDELRASLDQVAEIVDYFDSKGYAVLITKKSKRYAYENEIRKLDLPKEKWMFGATIIRELRESRGLTVKQLADEMGVETTVVYRIENKNIRHRYGSMKRFADYFGCDVEDLVVNKGSVKKSGH